MKKFILAGALTIAFSALSQAASGATPDASKPAPATSANRRTLPDAQIERNIKARLARSKMSGKGHFTVTVKDGVATLEGDTSVIQHKGVATRIAKLGGAIAVQNHIRISEEARAKAAARLAGNKAGAATSDGAVARATVLSPKK